VNAFDLDVCHKQNRTEQKKIRIEVCKSNRIQ